MTCIAAVISKEKGCVYVGTDTRVTGNTYVLDGIPKLIKSGNYLLAASGHKRFFDIALTHINIPPIQQGTNLHIHLIKNWIDDFREILRSKGILEINNNLENTKGGVLIASGTEVCVVSNQFYIEHPHEEGFIALGSGYQSAEAVIFNNITHNRRLKPETLIKQAIQATAAINNTVGGRIDIMHT